MNNALYNTHLRIDDQPLSTLSYGRQIYRRVVDVIMRHIRTITSAAIQCDGCENEWPSQLDHDCLIRLDEYMENRLDYSLKNMNYIAVTLAIKDRLVDDDFISDTSTIVFNLNANDDTIFKEHIMTAYYQHYKDIVVDGDYEI